MEVFAKYGKIVSAKVMIDHNTGRSVLVPSMAICEYGSMRSESMEVVVQYVNLLHVLSVRSRGFGFVSFSEHEAAMRAVDELNGSSVNSHVLYCGRAQKRKERQAELQRR